MSYFVLSPEVPGGFSDKAQVDFSAIPPRVMKLVVEFDDWLGDDLLTTHPVFFVTDAMRSTLSRQSLSGYRFETMKATRSELFRDIHVDDGLKLPRFYWLQVDGKAGVDDFGVSGSHQLVVSERALKALRTGRLNQCRVAPYEHLD